LRALLRGLINDDYRFAVGTDGKPYRTTDPNPLA